MICTRCNTDNRPTAAFCRDCGAILSVAFPVCGAKCAPENRFCDMCGAPLAGIPSLAGAPARFGPRRGYTPNHLTDRILTSRSAMQGERKQITVLFAAPLALEDHALRAGYAALRMLDHIARHGDEVQRRHGIPLQIRVGLNSG